MQELRCRLDYTSNTWAEIAIFYFLGQFFKSRTEALSQSGAVDFTRASNR